MKTTQHTPGPWAISPYNNITSKNGTIAKTEQMPGNDEAERKANARLISAAPDLLEALKALHSCHRAFSQSENWTTLDDEAREFAEIAIAKAEGVE